MSVKHLEYIKIKDSKLLVVEVRPVKCLLDTPSGPTQTDKWMDHSHWKELYHLLLDIVDGYEEEKATQAVTCNVPRCKIGEGIQMGYMFCRLPSCLCSSYFLTPRASNTWTENDDNGKLQDKGGRYESYVACGEMLVVSVILRDPTESYTTSDLSQSSNTSYQQQACVRKKLIKALDREMEYTNSISDYFKTSAVSSKDSSSKSEFSSTRKRKSSPMMVKISASSSYGKTFMKKQTSNNIIGQDGATSQANVNLSTGLHFTLVDHLKRTEKHNSDNDSHDTQLFHVLRTASMSKKVEDNVGRNADSVICTSPEAVSCESKAGSPLENTERNLMLTRKENQNPWLSENVQAEVGTEAEEGEYPQRSSREYAQQRNIRKTGRKNPRMYSLRSECPQGSVSFSESVELPLSHESIKKEAVESVSSTYLLQDSWSSKEKGDDVLKRVNQEHDVLKRDSDFCSTSVKKHVPEERYMEGKVLEEFLSQECLMSQINNDDRSSHVLTERYNADKNPLSSQNYANIQCNEFREELSLALNSNISSSCTKRSAEVLPSKRCFQKSTQLTSDKRHCGDLLASDKECQSSSQLGMKHGDGGGNVKVAAHGSYTRNYERSPELQCGSVNMEYRSGATVSLFSGEDPVIAGKKSIHDTQLFENLALAEKRKQINRKKQPQRKIVEESYFSYEEHYDDYDHDDDDSEQYDVQDVLEMICKSPVEVITPTRKYLSTGRSKKNSSVECSDVSVDSCSMTHCLQSPQNCTNIQSPVLREASSQQPVTCVTEEVTQTTSNKESYEKDKTLTEILRSARYFNNRPDDTVGSYSENKDCERKNAADIMENKTKSFNKSYVNEMKESVKMPNKNFNNHYEFNEKNYESEESVGDPSQKEWDFGNFTANHNWDMNVSSDSNNDLQMESHECKLQTSRFTSCRKCAAKKQRNPDNVLPGSVCSKDNEVESENSLRQRSSSNPNSSQSLKAKRWCRGDKMTDLSQDVECEGMKECTSPHDRANEEYIPKITSPRRIKPHKRNVVDYIPTERKTLSLAKGGSFSAESSGALAKESMKSDNSSEDSVKINSDETLQNYSPFLRSENSGSSEKCISSENQQLELRESEQMFNLRRSTRIKKKVNILEWPVSTSSDDDSDSNELVYRDNHISGNTVRSERHSNQYVEKKKNNGVLKQTKIKQSCSISRKECRRSDQLNISDEKSNRLTEKAEEPNDQSVKKKKVIGCQDEPHAQDETTHKKNHVTTPKKARKGKKAKTLEKKSKSDVENNTPNLFDDELYWLIRAESEKLDAMLNDSDDTLESTRGNQKKSRNSHGKEKQNQDKRKSQEDECFVLNVVEEPHFTLDFLRTSYRQLHSMTNNELEQRLNENLPYLENVIRGRVPNERHELFKQSKPELRMQQDYIIYGPFTEQQSLHVLDLLKKKLGHMDKLIGDPYDLLIYRCRVLVPTFFTKIVMDDLNVSLEEAYRLMSKFTLSKDIADDLD